MVVPFTSHVLFYLMFIHNISLAVARQIILMPTVCQHVMVFTNVHQHAPGCTMHNAQTSPVLHQHCPSISSGTICICYSTCRSRIHCSDNNTRDFSDTLQHYLEQIEGHNHEPSQASNYVFDLQAVFPH